MSKRTRHLRLAGALAATGIALAACGGAAQSSSPATGAAQPGGPAAAGSAAGGAPGGRVLPVTSNPIVNPATANTLKIKQVLVENNVDAAGKTVDDHLEIALSNTGKTPLTGVEVFYTFTDPTATATESYYAKLPVTFSIPAGGERVVNFDNTGAPDHYPVNTFSLYYTSKNALNVEVVASATGAAVQTSTLSKDAGGPEAAD